VTWSTRLSSAALLSALIGCVPTGDEPPATDAGAPTTDAGTPATDAGAPTTDAGAPTTDAGAPATDAGTPATDAGAPATDAGTPATDAGTPATDAGPSVECGDGVCTLPDESGCALDCDAIYSFPGSDQSLSPHGGTYPRALRLDGGGLFLAFDSSDPSNFVLRTAARAPGASWVAQGSVAAEPIVEGRTLANVFPVELPGGDILAAFRHHDVVNEVLVYRLLVAVSTDQGVSWSFRSEIEVGTSNGIWEPFLFVAPDGALHVYYAWEHDGGDQDIVLRRSSNSGVDWGPRITVASQGGSRDGMPAVATLQDGSLVAIFESFRAPGVPKFVVRTVRSDDDGLSWDRRADVYVPGDSSRNAGSPYVIALDDGRLVASFMTDEDATSTDWPNAASAKLLVSQVTSSDAPLSWAAAAVEGAAAPVYWPSLVVDDDGDVLLLYERGLVRSRRFRINAPPAGSP